MRPPDHSNRVARGLFYSGRHKDGQPLIECGSTKEGREQYEGTKHETADSPIPAGGIPPARTDAQGAGTAGQSGTGRD